MLHYDLGGYGRKITTGSKEAQFWFDRGLVWLYAYNHEAAIACFRKALDADAECAMAFWGIAAASGPNYNQPWEGLEPHECDEVISTARAAIKAAHNVAGGMSPVEQDLIHAIAKRFPDAPVDDFFPWLNAYAEAMREVHKTYPEDLDVAALFAEAMMNRTPWQLWDLSTGSPANGADTDEAREVLERALERRCAWDHPGILHFYIHLMEMSPTPELALRHGDRLSTLVPDAGHLIHMGTHIDVLCGDYHNVVTKNSKAIEADRKWLEREGADNFYTVYRCHNYHFKVYGAMFLGQPEPALAAAEELVETLPAEAKLRQMADWFEAFVPMKMHVLIRFGMWDDILTANLPEDRNLYAMTTAMMRYARAVALANKGDIPAAEAERVEFNAAHKAVPKSRMLFNNTCQDILKVAEAMMLGEIEFKKGNKEAALAHLRRSVELDDTLPYDEPWGWMQPTRHALGALLLDAGRYDEAEAIYRADLGLDDTLARACQHPANVWSLHGLHECLNKRGEKIEILYVKQLLDRALARAEVPIRASCYCRNAAT